MELKLIEKDKEFVKVEVEDGDETLVYPLVAELLKNEDVKEASYSTVGTDRESIVIAVRMKKGRPLVAIRKASEALMEEFQKGREQFQKGAKKK